MICALLVIFGMKKTYAWLHAQIYEWWSYSIIQTITKGNSTEAFKATIYLFYPYKKNASIHHKQ